MAKLPAVHRTKRDFKSENQRLCEENLALNSELIQVRKELAELTTAIHRASEAKVKSELALERHKFQTIFQSSPAAMALWRGKDFIFEMVNPRYQALFPGRQLLGKARLEAAPELGEQPFERFIQNVFESGEIYTRIEVLVRMRSEECGSDEDHFFDFTYARVADLINKPYGVFVHALDVTKRVAARKPEVDSQQALDSERERLYAAWMDAPAAIALHRGPELVVEFANSLYLKVIGATMDIRGKTYAESIPSLTADQISLLKKAVVDGKAYQSKEFSAVLDYDRNGKPSERFWNLVYQPVRDSSGQVEGVLTCAFEVTEHVRARQALADSEERFRQIANALPQIVWTATPEGFVDWYNDWWFKYLGMPRGIQWDDPEKQPMHPDDVGPTRSVWKECLATGKHYTMEQRFRRGSDGLYRWHRVSGLPVRDSNGRIIRWVGGNMDIHDQKEFTSHLEQERELRERFVATLSHDLRTPLTAAKSGAELMTKRLDDPSAIHRISARVVENIDRADQMIRDLLDANRLRAGESLPIEISFCGLRQVAKETLEELSTVHGDRFTLHNGGEIEGFWSPSGVRRILENLCTNAVKYGALHGKVTVSLERESEHARIEVHNEGSPISPTDQTTLFEPYRRAPAASQGVQSGWGLGLTLVKGLVEAHGGSVSVESLEGRGTTFRVLLPIEESSLDQ